MTLRPFTVARYAVYAALTVAVISAYLGYHNGASMDFVVLRGVFVFIIVCALGFAAEAILSIQAPTMPAPRPPAASAPAPEEQQAAVAESE